MKKRWNLLYSSIVLVCFLILLIGCSKDEYEIIHSKNKNDISFEQFKRETGLVNFETTFKIKKGIKNLSSARNADGSYELSDFIIDTEIIKRLDLNEKVTYTFRIFPVEVVSEKSIYNLTMHKEGVNWETSIVEFIPTDTNYQMISNGLTDQIQGKMKMLYESSIINTQNTFNCWTIEVVTYHCPYPAGSCTGPGGSCDALERYCPHCATYQSLNFCNTDEFGNSNGGYDIGTPISNPFGNTGHYPGGGSNGTGTGISPNNPEDGDGHSFTPNLESPNVNYADTPCVKIKSLTNKSGYKTNLKNLNTEANYNLPYERGFVENTTGSGTATYTWLNASGNRALNFPPGSKNFTHVHPKKMKTFGDGTNYDAAIKMLSPADVGALLTNCQQANGSTPEDAFGVMVSDEGHFAIKLLESVSLADGVINSKWAKFVRDYDQESIKIISDFELTSNERKEKLQKMFLKFLKDLGLGNKIAFFEGEISNTVTTANVVWTQKSLNNNGGLVQTPCN